MNELVLHAVNLSATATGALVSAIWQGALLAAIVFLVLRMLPGLSAAARSVIWLNVFILLALLHILPVFIGGQEALPAASASHAVRLNPLWSLAVAAVWLAMSLIRLAQLASGALHLRRMGRNAVPAQVTDALKPLLVHNGHPVALCASDEVARPSVLGFFRPRILVPPALLEQLSEAELKQVILHEMEHLHRGDDWTNLLQKLALVLFPLNPALAWVERRLCAERELACDDRVLHAGSGRKAYALCLTHLAEFTLVRRGFSLALGAWERRPELVRRVQRILSEPARSMGRRPALAAMAGLTTGALACTLILARSPQLVRFSPLTRAAQAQNFSPALDAHEVARSMGGTPQLVKAVLPSATTKPGKPQKAALCRRVKKAEPPARLANLMSPPPPVEVAGTLLVMTDFDDLGVPPQVVMAMQQTGRHTRRPVVVRCTFAVLQTPDGWLVIKI
ncbi:M56 family metallopeptidase [Occallatibacter riparius]|uniref:M56 family metallopeptidase n=1 Tax=Occallatibacter riparius TaxID=1002689 RepID=A0A9J7BV62_9BACT|nr:M56 family metallopeptidase [Occallatibacter riparius]UWZ84798.1 M56 family metallopeptidase [Occallatibacter riparius]